MPETPAYKAYVRQSPERILREASEFFVPGTPLGGQQVLGHPST
jgi:hypothetical protein